MELPNNRQHLTIIGRNGSGKTRAAVWHLAQRDYNISPWIIINHKQEELVNSIPGAIFVEDLNFIPNDPGIYIYQPIASVDDEAVTELMWQVYYKKNIGVYIDEGTMFNPLDKAMSALYTQGRSKSIPIITLSQRPTKINRYAISESSFFQLFHIIDKRDRETLQSFISININEFMGSQNNNEIKLPEFHSLYYQVNRNKIQIIRPVPNDNIILSIFNNKLNNMPNKNDIIKKRLFI